VLGGLLLFPQAMRSRQDGLKFVLDVATVVVAGTMAVWHFAIAPAVVHQEPSVTAFGLALAYPVGDLLLLLGLATVLLRYPRGRRRVPLFLLAAAVSAMMIGDLVWAQLSLAGAFEAGSVQDLLYLLQYVFFATAIAEERHRLRGRETPDDDAAPGSFSALPYVAVFGGYALFVSVAWEQFRADTLPIALGAVTLTLLVVLRQIVALKETARLDRERTLLAGEKRFKSLVQHASDVVSIIDAQGNVRFATPSAARMFGYAASTLIGRAALDLVHPADAAEVTQQLQDLAAHPGKVITGRWRIQHRDGRWIQTDNTATNLLADENIRGLVLATRDVTERVSLETKLTHQAYHDPLTGLANRVLFQHRLEQALTRRDGDRGVLAVLFIDLDKFKDVNDRYGHGFGDAVLRAAAHRIRSVLRSSDTAARLGGDEFAVLLDDPTGQIHPPAMAERIAREFNASVRIEGRDVLIPVSVGVALASPGQPADEILRNADLAMYLAKSRGRGQAAAFEPALHQALIDRLELQADLRNAVANNELTLAYQPLHALDGHVLVGAEALMRWSHPTRGAIPPDIFIPIAEESGLIVSMGRWALHRACADASRWLSGDPASPPVRLSVNLSARQLRDPALFDDVIAALRLGRLEASRLVLELTESILLDHTQEALAMIHRLKTLGVRIAIDDFGTGYSSLSYLRRLPIDELKIDRSFVERMEMDAGTAAVTRAIIAMAAELGLETVAEGIQSLEAANQLQRFGCEIGQGFFFSAAMPPEEFGLYAHRSRMVTAA
jgi:diguanylate cyclase (GGDEF)-like protein/PAS domain S-box-containing protein